MFDENLSLLDLEDQTENAQIPIEAGGGHGRTDFVRLQFDGVETIKWQDLFIGFESLHAITYSSGIGFICELLKTFGYAEIIFGFSDVMSYSLQEVMAYQLKTIERIREKSGKSKLDLIGRIDAGKLKLFVARSVLSHEKIYLLKASDGRKRVIMGSANMSYAGFGGIQRENIVYIDGDKAYNWYMACFEDLKESSSDDITVSSLRLADSEVNIEEIPISQTVKVKKALVVQPVEDVKEEIRFGLDVKNLAEKFKPSMPKADKKGKILLSPEIIKTTRRIIERARTQEKEFRSEYPKLAVDIGSASVSLNDAPLDLQPMAEDIKTDTQLFLEYMKGFEKFHGDFEGMQSRYYEFANWFFTTPFLAQLRNIAIRYNQNLLPYPVFGLIYGQSKAGKTSFLETILKMMIGQKTKLAAPEFTRTSIENLKRTVQGAPIIVDDLTNARFSQHAIETIKNDDFGAMDSLNYYPAVVISANEDVKAVAPEVIRRTVICRVQAGLTNTEVMKSNIVRHVQMNIGTAFYREYLRRMLDTVPDIAEAMKSDDAAGTPDILAASSKAMLSIFNEYAGNEFPSYIRELSLDDYFSEKVTGSNSIKIIQNAWRHNREAFRVDRRNNEIRYSAGETWEADRIIKELPENLEAHKSRECIVMDLEVACGFFGIDFKKRRFFGK